MIYFFLTPKIIINLVKALEMKKLFQIASPIIATFYIIAIGLMANETYVNKNCTEILNTKEHTIPGGYVSHSATCSGSSCVYLCKRKNVNGVGTCIGPKNRKNVAAFINVLNNQIIC
ncbi:hypothetical protein HID58_043851 [Brassica napus]|uniref:Uncharacterized protein n=2 Tax=Brassica TaxID=3705 RepID=A0ABQ8BHW8_BRANA|nr:hypothetical protein HID58_043851 [Brassica napus]